METWARIPAATIFILFYREIKNKPKWKRNSDLPDSNQWPKDVCLPTTVLRSTNWAKVGWCYISIFTHIYILRLIIYFNVIVFLVSFEATCSLLSGRSTNIFRKICSRKKTEEDNPENKNIKIYMGWERLELSTSGSLSSYETYALANCATIPFHVRLLTERVLKLLFFILFIFWIKEVEKLVISVWELENPNRSHRTVLLFPWNQIRTTQTLISCSFLSSNQIAAINISFIKLLSDPKFHCT